MRRCRNEARLRRAEEGTTGELPVHVDLGRNEARLRRAEEGRAHHRPRQPTSSPSRNEARLRRAEEGVANADRGTSAADEPQ